MNKLTIGIDIGATKIAGALVSREGKILKRIECPTNAIEGGQAVMARVADLALELASAARAPLEGAGVAAAGQIDPKTGVVLAATPLIPDWTGTRIKDVLEERLGIPARVINDGNAAALGEGAFGAARNVRDFVLLTIGTGVGGGIVSDGRLIEGASRVAGAIGHMVIDCDGRPCNCGSRGCLEAYTSGTSMASRALELADERRIDTPLIRSIRADLSQGAKLLGEAAVAGDSFALEVIHEAGEYLGWGLVSLINLFNPEMIVVGGSVAEMGDLLLAPAREVAMSKALKGARRMVRIVKAQLGNNAGILGAASLMKTTDGTEEAE
jgi:glucokinase